MIMEMKSLFSIIALTALFSVNANAHSDDANTETASAKQEQSFYKVQPSVEGAAEYFTGKVNVQPIFPENDTANYSSAYVTFDAGAYTVWHSHPAGQHIIVTDGTALTGTRDGKVIKFNKGESVWCPPDVDHWHGATADAPMTHLVVSASKDGKNVVWKERVSAEEYAKANK